MFKKNILIALGLFFHSVMLGKLVILAGAGDWGLGGRLGFDPCSTLCPLGSLCKRRPAQRTTLGPVLASSGCLNPIPWTVWFKQQEFSFSQFWKLQSETRVPTWPGSGQSSLPGLQQAAFSLCPHTAERDRDSSSKREFCFCCCLDL